MGGWFSFNTLSLFATILEQHLNGTWVQMFPGTRKPFKQVFETSKNTRRRSLAPAKLQQQKLREAKYAHEFHNLSRTLSPQNKQRFLSLWNEARLYWTDLVIESTPTPTPTTTTTPPGTRTRTRAATVSSRFERETDSMHKNHNNRHYRKKRMRSQRRNR